jgi:hypothetical protein
MPELDVALRELGSQVEFPPTPDIASAIRGRLERRRPWSRRPLAIALAVLIVAIGAVFAVPPARTAILDWLGLRHVSIVRVDKLPPTEPIVRLDLGRETSLARAPLWALVPDDKPDRVFVDDGTVHMLWGDPQKPRLLLSEFRGDPYIEKVVEGDTEVEPVRVNGRAGAWLEQPHVVMFKDPRGRFRDDPPRLAGKTLLWEHGEVTLRLEGDLTKEQALRIARSAD